jgi:hypothetical protein
MRKQIITIFISITIVIMVLSKPFTAIAQEDDKTLLKNLTVSGYIDAYYAWDTDRDKNLRQFPAFEPYRDQFKLNIAQITMSYNSDNVRGKATIQYGDIPKVLYPLNQQYIQEANVGISPYKNLWFDMGYFITHIGAEGLPINNFFSSYAMGSYFEPNYQSGIKISYDFCDKFSGCLHILNGYNLLDDNNRDKSFGLQLTYKANDKLSFVYNNIIGNEIPAADNESKLRFLNNLITYYSPTDKLDFVLGLDFATQEKSKLSDASASASLFSMVLSGRYKITQKFFFSLRGEYFNDAEGFLSGNFIDENGTTTGLNTWGITGAFEYRPVENYYIRFESRLLSADSKLKIFYDNSNTRTEVTLNSGIQF